MKVRWQDVKREIHDEVEKIWFDEPVEVTMSKLGVSPVGRGRTTSSWAIFSS